MKLKTSLVAGAFSLVLIYRRMHREPTQDHLDRKGSQARRARPEIRAVTQISAGRKIKDGPTNKGVANEQRGADEQKRATTRLEEVMTNHVRQESIAIQTPVREKRVASETNDLSGNFRVQGQHRKQ